MDELEKRRRQLADPNSHIDSLGDASIESLNETELAQLKANQAFENQLSAAFNIEVPEALPEKVLLNQRLRKRRNRLVNWSVAASMAFASLMSLHWLSRPDLPLSQHALNHVYHELELLQISDAIAPDQVLDELAKLNIHLPLLPEKVTSASICGMAGERVVHLVAEIRGQPVTLLITHLPIEKTIRFGDERFIGKMQKFARQGLIAIAEDQRLVDSLFEQIII